MRKTKKFSKLSLFVGNAGLQINAEVFFDFDGDCILLNSAYDGKTIGYFDVTKDGQKELKNWIEEDKTMFRSPTFRSKRLYRK